MDTRFRIAIILLVGVLTGAVWALPTWWPIVVSDSAAGEVFPGLAPELQVAFIELPRSEREFYLDILDGDEDRGIDPNPAWALALVETRLTQENRFAPESAEPFEAPPGSQVVSTGTFSDLNVVQRAEGDLTIYQRQDQSRLLRIEPNFSSSLGPDIHVVLTRNPDPTDERGIGADYRDMGELKGNLGAQNYEVPRDVNLNEYVVLALYSVEHDTVLATATLR